LTSLTASIGKESKKLRTRGPRTADRVKPGNCGEWPGQTERQVRTAFISGPNLASFIRWIAEASRSDRLCVVFHPPAPTRFEGSCSVMHVLAIISTRSSALALALAHALGEA
jgi:hypothetical protein